MRADVVAAGGGVIVDDAALSPDWIDTTLLPLIIDRDRLEAWMDAVEAQLVARLLSPDFREWSTTVSRVGFCAHPVRLVGRTDIFTKATGELVRSYSSSDEPAACRSSARWRKFVRRRSPSGRLRRRRRTPWTAASCRSIWVKPLSRQIW